MSTNITNFKGGNTTRKRVSAQERSVLARCSGWKISDGSLISDDMAAKVTTGTALPGATPQQVPFAHYDGSATKIIARDVNELMREHSAGAWGAAGSACDILPESIPAKLHEQIIFPTGGATPKLMAYEPGSATTKLRPLSLKAPTDYNASAAPTVTLADMGVNAPSQLFDNDDANAWTSTDAGKYTVSSWAGTGTKLSIGSTAVASAKGFTKSLGATGISLEPSGHRRFLILDLEMTLEARSYAAGLYSNDSAQLPSGYVLTFYSDELCTTAIQSWDIPACSTGIVTRLAFHINETGSTVKGVAISTASFFTAPTGSDHIILYSDAVWKTDLTHVGNFLQWEVQYPTSPWGEALSGLDNNSPNTAGVRQNVVVLQTLLSDGTQMKPANSLIEYCYCFCGKNLLGSAFFENMVSNPSLAATAIVADPWQIPQVTLTLPGDPITEYGDYLTHILHYRRMYNGEAGVWSDWELWESCPIGAIETDGDTGTNDVTTINGATVPEILEITNDYASSARHVITSGDRVYAGCLDWSNSLAKWQRPTMIEVSSQGKHWAFPTTVSSDSLQTDGSELQVPVETGTEIRGMLTRNDDKFIFLDNELFLLQGDSPVTGYRFWRVAGVGAKANTMINARGFLIWHDGKHFQAYAGGTQVEAISEFNVDSTLIDWTQPYGVCYCDNRYMMFCTHNSKHALIIYDLPSGGMPGSWRIRYSDAMDLVGISTDGQDVFGLTPDGNVVNLFDGATDYGAASTVREVFTQYVELSPTEYDVHLKQFVVEAIAASACTLNVTLRTHSKKNGNQTIAVALVADKTRYEYPINLKGDAVSIEATYTGTTALQIFSMGVVPGEVAAQ